MRQNQAGDDEGTAASGCIALQGLLVSISLRRMKFKLCRSSMMLPTLLSLKGLATRIKGRQRTVADVERCVNELLDLEGEP